MKIKLVVIVLFFVAICLAAIYPVKYYYENKQVEKIPKHVSYNMVIDSLALRMQQKAKKNNCEGYILSITEIKGNDPSLETLRSDLNLVLASHRGWKLKANKKIQQEMKNRFEERLKNWGPILSGDDLRKMLKQEQQASPNYSAKAELSKLNTTELIRNRRLFIYVYSEKTGSEEFNISEDFIHPATLKKLKFEKNAEESRLEKLKKKADFSLKMLFGFAFLFLLYILTFLVLSIIHKRQIDKSKKYLLQEIEKREELVNNGHFVAALEMVDRYLLVFPNDTEIRAFRERLLDFTNDDPKKAQRAYVEAKKIKLRLRNYAQNPNQALLTADEKKEFSRLLPYNADLKSSYTKLIVYEEKESKRKEFSAKFDEVEQLFTEKYLKKAKQKVTDLQRIYPEFSEVVSLKEDIENEQRLAEEIFEQINCYLQKGEIGITLKQLNEVLTIYKDLPAALKLKNTLEQNKKIDHISLIPEGSNAKPIEIFCKDEVVLGRKEIDVNPDIQFEDRRISRPHLKISIVDDKVIAEDLNSSAGSFLNGEKLLSQSLENKDYLNLSKTIDFQVFIQKQSGIVSGFILAGNKKDYLILTSKLEFGFDGKNITGENKDFSLITENKILLLLTENKGILLARDSQITLGNKKYTLEV